VATGALAAAAGWTASRSALALRGVDESDPVAPETQHFVARLALLINATFAFIILVQAVPIFFFLRAC
jgi:hypothetical protein